MVSLRILFCLFSLYLYVDAEDVQLNFKMEVAADVVTYKTNGASPKTLSSKRGVEIYNLTLDNINSLPLCFTNTYRANNNGQAIENVTKANYQQYMNLTKYVWGGSDYIFVLFNKNSSPDLCYYGSVGTLDFSCEATTYFYNDAFKCTTSRGGKIEFMEQQVSSTWFQVPEGKTVDDRGVNQRPNFAIDFSLTATGSPAVVDSVVEVAKKLAGVRAYKMKDLFGKLTEIDDSIQTRWVKLDSWMSTWWLITYFASAVMLFCILVWLVFCCSWVGLCNYFTKFCCEDYHMDDVEEDCGKCAHPCCGRGWWDGIIWGMMTGLLSVLIFTSSDIVGVFFVSFSGICFIIFSSILYLCLLTQCCYSGCCYEACNFCLCCKCCKEIAEPATKDAGTKTSNTDLDAGSLEMQSMEKDANAANNAGDNDPEDCQCFISKTVDACAPVEVCLSNYGFNVAHQKRLYKKEEYWISACTIVGFIFIMVLAIVFFSPKMIPYEVYMSTEPGQVKYEIAKTDRYLQLFYAMDGGFKHQSLDKYAFQLLSLTCGKIFDTELTTPEEKKEKIKDYYIDSYNIDMSIYEPEDWREYTTVNKWFWRNLKQEKSYEPAVRPIYGLNRVVARDDIVISPADSRFVVLPKVPEEQKVWLKDKYFTIEALLNGWDTSTKKPSTTAPPSKFEEGYDRKMLWEKFKVDATMMIFRLAPEDYHRWHWPLAGRIVGAVTLDSYLHSVNADAMTSGNHAIYNKRRVHYVKYGPGENDVYAYLYLGAMCTGSILFCPADFRPEEWKKDQSNCTRDALSMVGQTYKTGQMTGNFAFGGSTIVLLFPKDKIHVSGDLQFTSTFPVEQYLKMGVKVGTKK